MVKGQVLISLAIITMIVARAVAGWAGANAHHKMAVHIKSHPTSCAKGCPTFTGCNQIKTTWPTCGDIDVLPVFYDLVEYNVVEFGLMWPPEWYSMSWVRCAGDIALGTLRIPGDGTAIAWTACQRSWAVAPGYGWVAAHSPGFVRLVPNVATSMYGVVDCTRMPGPYHDWPAFVSSAGVCGMIGEDPCRAVDTRRPSSSEIRSMFK